MALSVTKAVGRDERTALAVTVVGILLGVATLAFAAGGGSDATVVAGLAAAAVLVWLGWRGRSYARRLVPSLARHRVVSLAPAEARAAAAAGEPFELPLGERPVEVRVEPSPPTDDDGSGDDRSGADGSGDDGADDVVAEVDEEDGEPVVTRRPAERVVTYKGGLVDLPEESEARLTITDDVLTGYVATPEAFWYVEPLGRFYADAAPDEHVVYRRADMDFALDLGEDTRTAGTTKPDDDVDNSVNPTVPIVMVADPEYDLEADLTGLSWYEQQASLVNQVNGIYDSELGVEFRVRWYILDLRSGSLTSTDSDQLLDQMEDPVQVVVGDIRQASVRQREDVEVAHLTTGKNLDGDTLGVAWHPGAHGLSQQTLAVITGGGGFGGGPDLGYQNMMVAAHELGHNFHGDHDEAAKWCVSHFLWCWDYRRSIMWATFYDDNDDVFSDGGHQSGKDNESEISNNMNNGRNVNFSY